MIDRNEPLNDLAGIGAAGRRALRRSRVLIAGVGGLGAPAALCLAAAGVGTLGLIDGDTVEPSNLHRQIVYRVSDIGRSKVAAAAERVRALNPEVAVHGFAQPLAAGNLDHIFPDFDFIIDGTDRIASKYLVNDGAVLHHIPFSHAGVVGFDGQTLTVVPGRSACVRCLFPSPPPAADVVSCQEAGAIGPVVGSIGLVQAAEALKYLLGIGNLLTDRLLTYNGATGRWRIVPVARNRHCRLCGDGVTIHTLEAVADGTEECL